MKNQIDTLASQNCGQIRRVAFFENNRQIVSVGNELVFFGAASRLITTT
jgi:hypothetical protein